MKFGKPQPAYACRCLLCSGEERLPQGKILRRKNAGHGCSACIRGNCVVCSKPVPAERPRSNTCSERCESEKKRATWRQYYAQHTSPEFNARRYEMQKAREHINPELAAARRESHRLSQMMYRQNPGVAAREQEYQHNRWAEMKTLIIRQRQDFFNSLSADEQQQRKEAARQRDREYRRRFREWLHANPDEHAQFIRKNREWLVERQRKRALAELINKSQELINRDNKK